ncbi:radical SAM protein [Thermodesulfobacteriota bacterium]
MRKTSSIGIGAVFKHSLRFLPYPWISSKLVKLQLEKNLFNMIHPDHKGGSAGKIRQASFRITDICNLRCHTCGQWGDSGFLHGKDLKELKQREVAPERYIEIFRDLIQNGHRPLLYFWGGEPMLYDGILDIIDEAASMGLPSAIATNGTKIAKAADRIVGAPLYLLQVSIDGHNAETQNKIRPSAGGGDSFKELRLGIEAVKKARKLKKSKLPLIASLTVVSKENFKNLVDIYETFRNEADLFVFYLSWWIDEERAISHEKDFIRRFGFKPEKHRGWIGEWKPDDYHLLDSQLQSLKARSGRWNNPPVVFIPSVRGAENLQTYYTDHKENFGFNKCISIYQAVEINSNGDMSPCRDYHDYVVGNIKESTITELWNSEPYIKFRKSLSAEGLMPVCSRCCGLMGY